MGLFGKIARRKKYDLGLVLSGGGARGYAHAGVIQALEERGLRPDVVSGVSAGAIVGAMYADGHSVEEMFGIFKEEENFRKLVKLTMPQRGLFKVEGLEKKLKGILKSELIEELDIKLIITATNISSARAEYFETGELIPRILASAAIPILFQPVEIRGDTYVDGGMVDNFPVGPIREQCKKVIGVSLNPIDEEKDFPNLWSIAERTFRITVSSRIEGKLDLCDIVIQPDELGAYGLLQTGKGREMFELGYEAAKKALKNF
jgi:NTE family protein